MEKHICTAAKKQNKTKRHELQIHEITRNPTKLERDFKIM